MLEDNTKVCAKCQEEKPHKDFNKCKRSSQGLHNHCRSCQKIVRHEWYLKHREEELEKSKIFCRSEEGYKSRQKRYLKYREIILKKSRERRRLEPAKIKQRANEKLRRQTNPNYRIRHNLNIRLRQSLKNIAATKSSSMVELIGLSIPDFIKYLESKFQKGMSWDNYGIKGWHIDHIIPCVSFDLTKEEEQRKCYHYTNLQPLWWYDNLAKGDKIL